jgi:5-methylcytosine-specific restriction enzyme subunit McrC
MESSRIIKIFEDRQQRVSLSEQEKKDIVSMKSVLGENNIILQADGKLLIKHYVGFVQVNKTRLLIYPKISIKSVDESQYDRSFGILMKLLAYSEFTAIKKTPDSQFLDKYEGDLLELFIGLFVDELLLQFKRDINRGYKNQMENQSFIKGKVDFSETVKRNSFRRHLHCVRYDQFTEDILLNRIFKSVIGNLLTRTKNNNSRRKLKQSLLWLEDVDKISLDNEIWKKVRFTRHNSKYEPAFNMARLFYYNSSPNLNTGDEYTFSFLVPVNRLFELYLYKVMKNNTAEDYSVRYQSPINYLAKVGDKNCLQLRPDITLLDDNGVKCILDAKYKEVTFEDKNLRLAQSDIYQMLAYGVRYKCNRIALIYPKFLGADSDELLVEELKIENYDEVITVKVLKVDLELEPGELSGMLDGVLSQGV